MESKYIVYLKNILKPKTRTKLVIENMISNSDKLFLTEYLSINHL